MEAKDKVTALKGIGKKRAEQLKKKNIETLEDLIRFYPKRYVVHEEASKDFLDSVKTGKPLLCVVSGTPKTERKNGKMITKAVMADKMGNIFLATWFNMTGKALGLTVGKVLVLDGKCSTKDNFNFITHPTVYELMEYEKLIGKPLPVYSLTEGLTSSAVNELVNQALDAVADTYNWSLPDEVLRTKMFKDVHDVLKMIHNPANERDIRVAEGYLAYEELFSFVYKLKKKAANETGVKNSFPFAGKDKMMSVISSLPFKLTDGQKKAVNDIYRDLNSENITRRLIQGDVGCGKTMIAALALLYVLENNHQGVFLAPTEVLARQHFKELKGLSEMCGLEGQIRLLTSETKNKEREEIISEIREGYPIIVVGTHAVINVADDFYSLALVVIDEQHKFGVNQREELTKNNPHVITMTATPIPRTLSLTIYGEDAVSEINELPSDRLPVKNCVISEKMIDNAYRFIGNQINKGHQAYIVCPAIEVEGMKLFDVETVEGEVRKRLPHIKVASVHGKTDKKIKEEVMRDYREGKIDVLVSTTVIEVGVNVPNATTMMIMNAERFGLSSLHQLRGRIGRGKHQSYCIFIDSLESETSRERMNIISSTNNGFEIAKKDLLLRGPGELLGTEQSGAWNFKKADITDEKFLQTVTKDVVEYMESCKVC